METLHAVIDGNYIVEPALLKGKYRVEIIIKENMDEKEEKRQAFLKFFGTGDDEDVQLMQEMINERANSSSTRGDYDFS